MRGKVLIVAAEPLTRAALARELRGEHEIAQAKGPEQALAILRTESSVCCVVVEHRPGAGAGIAVDSKRDGGSGGLELLRIVRDHRASIGRVLVADCADPAIEQAIANGLIDWFVERVECQRELTQAVHYGSDVRMTGAGRITGWDVRPRGR